MKEIKNLSSKNITVSENLKTFNLNSVNVNSVNVNTENLELIKVGSNNITYTQFSNGITDIAVGGINDTKTYINHQYQEYYMGGFLIQAGYIGSIYTISSYPSVVLIRYNDISQVTEINAFRGSIDIIPINNSTYISNNDLVINISSALSIINNISNDTIFKFKNSTYSQSLVFRTPYNTYVHTNGNNFRIAINIGSFNNKQVLLNGITINPNTNIYIVIFNIPLSTPKQIGLKIDFCVRLENNIINIDTPIIGIP